MMAAPEAITALLQRWSEGDDRAVDELVPLVMKDLRRIAQYQMRGERKEHTLQPTALVNEAYVKLAKQKNKNWENRAHFIAVASRAMRQVLVDYARKRNRKLRKVILVPLDSVQALAKERPAKVLALDEALNKFAKEDPRKARMAELRVFGGLSDPEVADLLGVSITTVGRDWKFAKARLRQLMEASDANDQGTTEKG